jgi:uncharacterized protein
VTTIDDLRHLQELDSRIDADRERITTIEATVSNRSEYESARRDHQAKSTALKGLEAEQRDVDLQVGQARQQLATTDQRLYSGQVRNPRELEDLRHKGDELRRQVATLEERDLLLMEQVEAAATVASEAEERLRQMVTDRRTLETSLLEERKTLAAEVRSTTAERDKLRPGIDASALHTYDRLRSTRGGVVVVEVKQRTCQGCRVSLTAAAEQRLRHTDAVMTCQSCGRLLYTLQ